MGQDTENNSLSSRTMYIQKKDKLLLFSYISLKYVYTDYFLA